MPPITSYFSRATPEQAAEQATRGFEQIRHASEWEKARKLSDDSAQAQRQREAATQRQKRRRQRLKEAEIKLGLRNPRTLRKVKPMVLQDKSAPTLPTSPPPDDLDPMLKKPIQTKRRRRPRINWFEPVRWALISAVVKKVGFSSPQDIVRELKVGASGVLFANIERSTIVPWINTERTGWTQAVLTRVARAAKDEAPRAADPDKVLGRPSLLAITVIASIVLLLTNMRNAGTIITQAVTHSVILAFICTNAPELLEDPTFKCSRSYVIRLLRNKMDWSWRAATQAAQKLPDDWLAQCLDFGHRLTWHIVMNNIPPELIINADQTGVLYLGAGSRTWELKGVSQVSAVGHGEKRQFTLMVAVTTAGKLLPFQAIFKGKTDNSLPSAKAWKPCEKEGFLFTPGGPKHWSTLESMKEWVDKVLAPYLASERKRLNLRSNHKAILTLDCWAVHRGAPFRDWMKQNHPSIILLFVPGGCTSVAQPCDTRINRVLKHLIKSACVEYLSQETQSQLRRGIPASKVEINTKPTVLRDASTTWLLDAWTWFQERPDVEDQTFSLAISAQIPNDPNFAEADSPDYDDDLAIDPSVLCDIRGRLPPNVVECDGQFDYVSDEEVLGSDLDSD